MEMLLSSEELFRAAVIQIVASISVIVFRAACSIYLSNFECILLQ